VGFAAQIRSLLVPGTAMAARDAAAQADVLEGLTFEGIVLECGKTAGDADTLIFRNGRFRSTACDRYEYGDGPYNVTLSGDAVSFTAETESPKYGQLRWHGVVRGRRLDGTLTMLRDGKVLGEKWVLAGRAG